MPLPMPPAPDVLSRIRQRSTLRLPPTWNAPPNAAFRLNPPRIVAPDIASEPGTLNIPKVLLPVIVSWSAPGPLIVIGCVTAGSALASVIVPVTANVITCGPLVSAFASSMAWRRLPAPLSLVVVTENAVRTTAGSRGAGMPADEKAKRATAKTARLRRALCESYGDLSWGSGRRGESSRGSRDEGKIRSPVATSGRG
ncbi:hypothetical protein ACFJIW_14765 [Tahibacter sp. UC22_41]|uniref:hypothetical protein n=1 Tax=Tahibacter sp. UC22_41 TaxID=3350178 RepID=UPI0036DF4BB2